MNTTIQINPTVWTHAMAYANSRGEQLATIVERLLMSLYVDDSSHEETSGNYYISSRIKALETGFKCSDNLSEDYKQEISEARCRKYQ